MRIVPPRGRRLALSLAPPDRLDRNRRIDLHMRHAENANDRRDVANEIEVELVVERRVDAFSEMPATYASFRLDARRA